MITMLEYMNIILEMAKVQADELEGLPEADKLKLGYLREDAIAACKDALNSLNADNPNKFRVFFKNAVGWISFKWGEEGDPPPKDINTHEKMVKWLEKHTPFEGGYGISHIIAKRDWEGKHIKEFLGQKGKDIIKKLPNILVNGQKVQFEGRIGIKKDGLIVLLQRDNSTKPKNNKAIHQDFWVITGYVEKKKEYEFVFETAGETVGVGLQKSYIPDTYPAIAGNQAESASWDGFEARGIILSDPTLPLPTVYRQGKGAADQKLDEEYIDAKRDFVKKQGPWFWF